MNYRLTISPQYVLLNTLALGKANCCPQIEKKGISVLHVQA